MEAGPSTAETDSKLLKYLAPQRVLGRLAVLDLSAGKLPEAAVARCGRALRQEYLKLARSVVAEFHQGCDDYDWVRVWGFA